MDNEFISKHKKIFITEFVMFVIWCIMVIIDNKSYMDLYMTIMLMCSYLMSILIVSIDDFTMFYKIFFCLYILTLNILYLNGTFNAFYIIIYIFTDTVLNGMNLKYVLNEKE